MSQSWNTPQSSNVVSITLDGDDCVVEYKSGTYVYLGVTEELAVALAACMDAGASAGRTVRLLLHPLPYQKLS